MSKLKMLKWKVWVTKVLGHLQSKLKQTIIFNLIYGILTSWIYIKIQNAQDCQPYKEKCFGASY